MMSYALRSEDFVRDDTYGQLKIQQTRIETLVTQWMADATQLHADTADATEKTELITFKGAFATSLETILGV